MGRIGAGRKETKSLRRMGTFFLGTRNHFAPHKKHGTGDGSMIEKGKE